MKSVKVVVESHAFGDEKKKLELLEQSDISAAIDEVKKKLKSDFAKAYGEKIKKLQQENEKLTKQLEKLQNAWNDAEYFFKQSIQEAFESDINSMKKIAQALVDKSEEEEEDNRKRKLKRGMV